METVSGQSKKRGRPQINGMWPAHTDILRVVMAGKKGLKKRVWSDDEKRTICAQTLTPGVSVAQVARHYSMNANLILSVSIRRRPLPCYIDQRLLVVAFGLRGFGVHFLARRSKLSRMRPISASSGSNFPPYHSSIGSCSSCLGSAMPSRKSA